MALEKLAARDLELTKAAGHCEAARQAYGVAYGAKYDAEQRKKVAEAAYDVASTDRDRARRQLQVSKFSVHQHIFIPPFPDFLIVPQIARRLARDRANVLA